MKQEVIFEFLYYSLINLTFRALSMSDQKFWKTGQKGDDFIFVTHTYLLQQQV